MVGASWQHLNTGWFLQLYSLTAFFFLFPIKKLLEQISRNSFLDVLIFGVPVLWSILESPGHFHGQSPPGRWAAPSSVGSGRFEEALPFSPAFQGCDL